MKSVELKKINIKAISSPIVLWGWVAFFISAILGAYLRYYYLNPIEGLNYRNILHAHSHLALLGWLTPMMLWSMIPELYLKNLKIRFSFHLIGVSAILMTGIFFFYGYNAISISLSVLHSLLTLLVAVHLFKISGPDDYFLKYAVIWLLISMISVMAVGPFKAIYGSNSIFYFLSIQFFLHIIFNGWLVFSFLFIFKKIFKSESFDISINYLDIHILNVGIILSFFLQIHWMIPKPYFMVINAFGVLFLLYIYGKIIIKLKILINLKKRNFIYNISMFSFILVLSFKMIALLITAVPIVSDQIISIRSAAIAFFHLNALGISSLSLFIYWFHEGIISENFTTSWAIILYTIAFIWKEILLVLQTVLLYLSKGFLPKYEELLWAGAMVFPISISLFIYDHVKHQYLNKIKN